jgi:hypothetical protein
VDHGHPQWLSLSLFFFFFLFAGCEWWVAAGGGIWAGSPLFGCLIGCFVLILNLCVFLEMMRCQVMSGGQKITHLCNYRITAALYVIYLYLIAIKKGKC